MKPVNYTGCKEVPHCGTTAVAIISDRPVAEIIELIREFRGERQSPDKPVAGMEDYEIMSILGGMGIYPMQNQDDRMDGRISTIRPSDGMIRKEAAGPISLRMFCRTHKGGPFMVLIDDESFGASLHAIVVEDGMICCSMTNGKPVRAEVYPFLDSVVSDFRRF